MASAMATSSSAAAATSSSVVIGTRSSYSPESQRASFSMSSASACLSATPNSRARRPIGDVPRDTPSAPPPGVPSSTPRRELFPRLSCERSSLSLASRRCLRVLRRRPAATSPPTILVAMISSMTTRLVTWTPLVTVNHTATRCRNGATSSRRLGSTSWTNSAIKFKTISIGPAEYSMPYTVRRGARIVEVPSRRAPRSGRAVGCPRMCDTEPLAGFQIERIKPNSCAELARLTSELRNLDC